MWQVGAGPVLTSTRQLQQPYVMTAVQMRTTLVRQSWGHQQHTRNGVRSAERHMQSVLPAHNQWGSRACAQHDLYSDCWGIFPSQVAFPPLWLVFFVSCRPIAPVVHCHEQAGDHRYVQVLVPEVTCRWYRMIASLEKGTGQESKWERGTHPKR